MQSEELQILDQPALSIGCDTSPSVVLGCTNRHHTGINVRDRSCSKT